MKVDGAGKSTHQGLRSRLLFSVLAITSISVSGAAQAQETNTTGQAIYQHGCRLEREGCSRDMNSPIIGVAQAPALFNNVQLATHEFLATAIDFNKDKVKLVISPFRLSASPTHLSSLSFNLAGGDGTYTAGAGWGIDPTDPLSRRGRKLVRQIFDTVRAARDDEIDHPEAYLDSVFRPAYGDYYKQLLQNVWTTSLAVNLVLFDEVAGREVDRDGDSIIDNAHALKGFTLTPSVSYNFNYRTAVGAAYYFSRRRKNAAANSDLATYNGVSLSVDVRAILLDTNFQESSDFVTDFFVPTVDVGMSAEFERCSGSDTQCEDDINKQWALTPYVSIRASPKAQFRLGVMIRKSTLVAGEDGTSVAPLLQYVLQFGAPK